MKPYVASLAIGLLVGVIYALFNVRSPAPPVIALVGLLGILLGEQIPPLVKQAFRLERGSAAWIEDHVKPHVFGQMPQCKSAEAQLGTAKADSSDPGEASRLHR
jgi:XapX domain-containing protein